MTVDAGKPNLFIVGAAKCGTTAWYEYLGSHPDIFMCDPKEPGFFATDLPNWRGFHSEEEYSALFADRGSARFFGEASGIYLISNTAAEAIRDYNPAAKILIFLRDQEEFLPSFHNLNRWEFDEEISDFETAWRLSGHRPPDTIPASVEPRILDYVAIGCFREQVTRYLDAFRADQVRVFWFRDWVANPRLTYLDILHFLNLNDDGRSEFRQINPGVTFRPRWLVRFLRDPPPSARTIVRLLKRRAGLRQSTQDSLVENAIQLLSAPGYKKDIGSQLRDEIRRYYAEDNRRLNERLHSIGSLGRPGTDSRFLDFADSVS